MKDDQEFSEAEAERRRDRTLQTMLRTRPQPNWQPPNVRPRKKTQKKPVNPSADDST